MIALSSLQPLISFRAASLSTVPAILQTMNDCTSQGVDVELKVLQPLLSLVTNFPAVHGQLLANVRTSILLSSCPPSLVACPDLEYAPVALQALLLYFMLLESRMAVVPSTAVPTLQQLVVDKVVEEDHLLLLANELESIALPS